MQPLLSCKPVNIAIRSHRWIATGSARARQQPSHAAFHNPVGASPARERAAGALDLMVQALRNEPITLSGDDTQSRSFCYVDRRIEGFLRLMQSLSGFTSPVNLGGFTMIELAEAIRYLTGSRSALVHRPLPADDPRQRQPDIRLAREYLGWEPKIPLREGLKPTIAYFEQLLSLGSVPRRAVA
jgi:nucleoside-diphosphate-sugar epimerase